MIRSEVRVRPVTRYLVTEFTQDGASRKSDCLGTYPSMATANRVGASLAKSLGESGSDVTFQPMDEPFGVYAFTDAQFRTIAQRFGVPTIGGEWQEAVHAAIAEVAQA
jgi:hypothetical protein